MMLHRNLFTFIWLFESLKWNISYAGLTLEIYSDTVMWYQTGRPQSSSASCPIYNMSSNYLFGVTAYSGQGLLHNNDDLIQLQNKDFTNVIGFGNSLDAVLPSSTSDAKECCNTTSGLTQLINSGDACTNYANNNYGYKMWTSDEWLNKSRDSGALILPFIFLKETCNKEPITWHCLKYDTSGGTPNIENSNQLKWWQLFIEAYVDCTIKLGNEVGSESQEDDISYHLWNEPNAHFEQSGKDGDYYEEFYSKVVTYLKDRFDITIGGPVTDNTPTSKNVWEDYYLPLFVMNHDAIEKIRNKKLAEKAEKAETEETMHVSTGRIENENGKPANNHASKKEGTDKSRDSESSMQRKRRKKNVNMVDSDLGISASDLLLDFFDYHGYNTGAYWDRVVTDFNLINIYNWIYNNYNIRTAITETGYNINSESDYNSNYQHWKQRTMPTASQIMGISHYPNKFKNRQLFDLEAESGGYFTFWGSIDEHTNQVLGNMQNKLLIKQNLYGTGSSCDAFYYDSGSEVMTQVVIDADTNRMFVYILNNKTSNVDIEINDVSNIIQFDTDNTGGYNKYASDAGIRSGVSMSKIDNSIHKIQITLSPMTMYQISGVLVTNVNSLKAARVIEYNCDSTDSIMTQITSSKDTVSVTCDIYVSNMNLDSDYSIKDGWFRMGLVGFAAGDFTWQLSAKTNTGKTYYKTISPNGIQYVESYIHNDDSFLDGIELNNKVTVTVSSTQNSLRNRNGYRNDSNNNNNNNPTRKQNLGTWIPGRFAFVSLVLRFEQ